MKSLIKITPIILLGYLVITGMDILVAAAIVTVAATIVAMATEKLSFNDVLEKAVDNVKELIVAFFILMIAYAMAEAFMSTGVGASVIIISLKLGVTAISVAAMSYVVTCVLSVATGTSFGTFAACAPIFLWLTHLLGGNIFLTTAAIAGGSCFGDNLGLISDTTIVSSAVQKVEVLDRVKYQSIWSLLCMIVCTILFWITGKGMGLPGSVSESLASVISEIPKESIELLMEERPAAVALLDQVGSGVPLYMIIPLILVLFLAFKGHQTILCLGAGIVSSLLFGLFAGTVPSISDFLDLVGEGFSSAGSWSIIMTMWIGAFGGIMAAMNAFEPIGKFIVKISRSVRQLLFYNGLLCLFGNAALAEEMGQIVTIGPIIKSITDENVECSEEDMYRLRLRNSTYSDAMGVLGSQLVPWHSYIAFFIGIASGIYPLVTFTPFDIIKYNYMAFVGVGSLLILTLTGLDRFIPLFKLPKESDMKLKKNK